MEVRRRQGGFEVAFVPWLGWEREIALGPVTFSPFSLDSLQEPPVRDYLFRYFPRYREPDGKPVRVVVFARHQAVDGFRHHTPEERVDLSRAAAALALAFIAEAWRVEILYSHHMGVPSADSFQLNFQRFKAGSDFVAVSAGRTLQAWPLDEVIFSRPWAASAVLGDPNKYALEGLSALLLESGRTPTDSAERIWRALEWFRLAHLDGASQTDEAKMVGMATAFESFFGLPEAGKQAEFVKRVETLVRNSDMRRGQRTTFKGKSIDLSLAGCWAWDFYGLRSRLVHGDPVPPVALNDGSGLPHLVVADLVFRECLLRQLFGAGLFGSDLLQRAAELTAIIGEVPSGPQAFDALDWVVADRLGFRQIHEKLGWSAALKP